MAHHVRSAMTFVKAQMALRLPVDVDQLAREVGHGWRERTLSPAVTLWFFALQILNGNCAINSLRHIGGLPTQASSYCCARMKLPLAARVRKSSSQIRFMGGASRAWKKT